MIRRIASSRGSESVDGCESIPDLDSQEWLSHKFHRGVAILLYRYSTGLSN
jgi:hypothetical protein